jgi:hypothetical protein
MEQLDSPLAVERPSERSEAGWGDWGGTRDLDSCLRSSTRPGHFIWLKYYFFQKVQGTSILAERRCPWRGRFVSSATMEGFYLAGVKLGGPVAVCSVECYPG